MNRTVSLTMIILPFLLWIAGCAHLPEAITGSNGSGEFAAGWYMEKADRLIRGDELQLAWNHLDIARQLAPENKEINLKISKLKDEIIQKADHHFKKGVTAYNHHDLTGAKKEFLTVLRYFPEHKAALNYLKNRIHPENHILYPVQKGDTPEAIAQTVYKNKDLAFLIEYCIALEKQEADTQPSLLHLPILEKKWIRHTPRKTAAAIMKPESESKIIDRQRRMRAKQLFKQGDYQQVISLTEDMIKKNPDDPEVMKLFNYSCYYEGKTLIRKKQLIPARDILNRITMDLTDIDQLRSELRMEMQNQSEFHYRSGVTHFINEDLRQAIIEWEKTLALTPENQKAEKAIENAKNLLHKLEGVK
ncbi:MAG: hypothetical protein ABIK15_09945 [Pseudomonadota bacterium]